MVGLLKMLYLIIDEKTTPVILAERISDFPFLINCRPINENFMVNNNVFAKIEYPGAGTTTDQTNKIINHRISSGTKIIKFIRKEDFLAYLIYLNLLKNVILDTNLVATTDTPTITSDHLLQQNKLKFLLAIVKYNDKNVKEFIGITNYIDLTNNIPTSLSIVTDSPDHHYEAYNYKTQTFISYINKLAATNLLEQLKNEFLSEPPITSPDPMLPVTNIDISNLPVINAEPVLPLVPYLPRVPV